MMSMILIANIPPVTVSEQFSLLKSLYQLSPILAVMALVIVYLGWMLWKVYQPEKGVVALKDKQLADLLVTKDAQIKVIAEKKEEEIKELNAYIRENDKENLEVLSSLNNTMDKLIQTISSGNEALREKIATEAITIKAHVDAKIAEIKNRK